MKVVKSFSLYVTGGSLTTKKKFSLGLAPKAKGDWYNRLSVEIDVKELPKFPIGKKVTVTISI